MMGAFSVLIIMAIIMYLIMKGKSGGDGGHAA